MDRVFVLFMSCVCHDFASFRCCLVVTCWERADLLARVCDVSLSVSWVRCGTWLYRFLIFAAFLTFIDIHTLCVRAVNALVRLWICAGLSKPSLPNNAFSTTISCAGSFKGIRTAKLLYMRDYQIVLGPFYFGLAGNENLTITFQYNLPSKQCT